MNVTLKKTTIAILASTILSGCAGMSPATFGTTTERTLLNAESFEDFNLQNESDYNHSDAMQIAYLSSRIKVHKANDLDRNADGFNNVSVRTTQAATAVAATTATLNPFQAAFRVIGMQSNLSKMNSRNKETRLIRIIPVNSKDELELAKLLKSNQEDMVNLIKQAYQNDDSVSSVTAFSPKEEGISTYIDDVYVVPLNSEGNAQYCSYPELFNDFNAYIEDANFEPHSGLPISSRNCFAKVQAYGHYYTDSVETSVTPESDFVVMTAMLPSIFPIDELETEDANTYVYQPALAYIRDENILHFLKDDIDTLKPYWDAGFFSTQPRVVQISNKEELMFGAK
ncbi:TPA: hypothetical protein NJ005_005172 [Vibrio parahaemolyticus]|nr:hypothetical protein [Vibrio parahaemolyticus]HCG5512110.1 hypothetical protein [Vibrio parahaemolyticus]